MTTRPPLFGLLIALGFAGVPTFAFDEDRTILGQENLIFRDKEGRELTGKLLALSENTAEYYKAKELVVMLDAGEPTVEPPAPPLPPNCSYLNLWSYYYRWTTAGQPIYYDEPFAPTISADYDSPLLQEETYLFAPPENISFATADCGLTYDNPCIIPIGAVTEEGFGKGPVGKMIQNVLSVNDVDSCSDEDIGYSTNMMIFLDPKVNAKSGIVQYQSSLAVYEFQANTKADCTYNSNIASYPITGGTGLLLSASGSVTNGKQVNVEREDGFFDMYFEYVYTVCTPHSVPPPGPPVPKNPKKGNRNEVCPNFCCNDRGCNCVNVQCRQCNFCGSNNMNNMSNMNMNMNNMNMNMNNTPHSVPPPGPPVPKSPKKGKGQRM